MTSNTEHAAVILLNRLEEAVFIVDPTGRIMHANAAGHSVLAAQQGSACEAAV